MELVEFFKDEVNSIVNHPPPVSKAKMDQITRAARKAMRFYKHVVMAVERFIERCPPEYKLAGLYVIDSIVRQSRHMNGKDKDIFGPRFSRNLQRTFDNLFSGCLREDRPRIVRVLNLWQKNGVFNARTIQPLLDLGSINGGSNGGADGVSSLIDETNSIGSNQNDPSQNIIAGNSSTIVGLNNNINSNTLMSNNNNNNSSLRISKSVLDFDYGEDDDDDADETPTEAEPPLSSTLNKFGIEQRRGNDLIDTHSSSAKYRSSSRDTAKQSPSNNQMIKSNEPDPVLERWNKLMSGQPDTPPATRSDQSSSQSTNPLSSTGSSHSTQQTSSSTLYSTTHRDRSHNNTHGNHMSNHTLNSSNSSSNKHQHQHKHNARPTTPTSRESPKTKSSSSPTNNHHHSTSSKSRSSSAAEKEAERKRKCFPRIRDRHVTLCSSTLWLGHVPKSVTEADISDAFGEFGTIISIDLIPPRGCSYVCMDRRQDAKMALYESRDLKLKGSRIKMAWAPGKGLKEYKDLKDYFEVDIGCAYIPYSKITPNIDFDTLEDGGVIDEDSMSMEMIETRERIAKEKLEKKERPPVTASLPVPIVPQIISQSIAPSFHHLPAASMTNVPPPSSAWVHGQPGSNNMSGGIPYPPPRLPVAVTSSSSITTATKQTTNSGQVNNQLNNSIIDNSMSNHEHNDESNDKSPISLEHKISITEHQISMVEQQLSMMQQGQIPTAMGQMSNQMVPSQLMNQIDPFGNPIMFDVNLQGLGPLPPQLPMFAGPPPGLFGQPAPLLSMSQNDDNNLNMSLDGNSMHYGDRY